ncbi:cytochrome bd-I oxidase subunit CydX [Rhodopseudomonas palustris]|uniref:Cytochrome bd-I oxidase subunit CydX n=1 Tax=Rhodopseudomonas palustris TaxID=1076 RepID=A0A323UHM8_RHOPL|nr:cytochrome bd-I oxidase subunit CydX [Rhodopseudomonas palustris]PZA11727.1 cytochrome bd-I oxidase subunit CydX [Rhodopseudomonas palustris]
MWYFAWILGVTAAAAIAVINVMWYEFQDGLVVAVPTHDRPDGSQVPERVV